ncbi:unnamed protein product [Linum trigynum]|uniref:Uncharacterized protein n=1 Tax=Linum trigynum TaxID=586398 RepID=A0AAV2GQW9_9ROSI
MANLLHLQLQRSWLTPSSPHHLPPLSIKPSVAVFPSKFSPFRHSLHATPLNNAESSDEPTSSEFHQKPAVIGPVKLAFEKAEGYKKSATMAAAQNVKIEDPIEGPNEEKAEVPDPVKAALEKAKVYKKNKGAVGSDVKLESNPGVMKARNGRDPGSKLMDGGESSQGRLSVSKLDFVGLDFGERKRGKGLPAGLVPTVDPYPAGDLPDVEIIVGDTSNFRERKQTNPQPAQEDSAADLYKPKVSTWGVFPRPGNISKTFGGGKTIRPGDVLETEEERASKDARTRQMVAAYRKKVGLNIDPKLKSECDKTLKDGDSLMDSGKLNDALTYYQTVMDKLPFQSELHGLAALQWSICQDSLNRPNEARAVYEKLQSHPNPKVSKRARQLMFSFQAMEMMKVTGSNFSLDNPGYQDYFEKFVQDKTNYSATNDEGKDYELEKRTR